MTEQLDYGEVYYEYVNYYEPSPQKFTLKGKTEQLGYGEVYSEEVSY